MRESMPRYAAGQLISMVFQSLALHAFTRSIEPPIQFNYTVNARLSAEIRNGRKLRRNMRREYAALSSTQPSPAISARVPGASKTAIFGTLQRIENRISTPLLIPSTANYFVSSDIMEIYQQCAGLL